MIGEHNVYDALAAIVAGRVLGIKSNTIRKGLKRVYWHSYASRNPYHLKILLS